MFNYNDSPTRFDMYVAAALTGLLSDPDSRLSQQEILDLAMDYANGICSRIVRQEYRRSAVTGSATVSDPVVTQLQTE
jgi:hypothetical protein